ncbi:MAG: terminase [Archangium sp.]
MSSGVQREGGLLAWQFRGYPEFHASRTNLIIHVLTVPLFQWGTLLVLFGWVWGFVTPLVGLFSMAIAVIAQGRGHGIEKNPPIPFASRGEGVARIFLEQWVNFPRFVVTGGFGKAWRGSAG